MRKFWIATAYVALALMTHATVRIAMAQRHHRRRARPAAQPDSVSPGPCILLSGPPVITYDPDTQIVSGEAPVSCTRGNSSGCKGTIQAYVWYDDPIDGWELLQHVCDDISLDCNSGPIQAGQADSMIGSPTGTYCFGITVTTGNCQSPGQTIATGEFCFNHFN